jgi:hypothetical protein
MDSENLAETSQWLAYRLAPSGVLLAELLTSVDENHRFDLVESMENLFHETKNWRIAQHIALVLLDRFEPHTGRRDLVKAFYYANRACNLSEQDPRARATRASIIWDRRVAGGVLHDTERALADLQQGGSSNSDQTVLRIELLLLSAMAHAYLGDTTSAHTELVEAEALGGVSLEALTQLMLSSGEQPHHSYWAAIRLVPFVHFLGRRPEAVVTRQMRHGLLRVLRARAE